MPNLSIKNVPAGMVEKLRERAARNHRSMQGELMAVLQDAVDRPEWIVAAAGPAQHQGTVKIGQIIARNRKRWGAPVDKAPRAVDIIRADRDERSR